jgi:predicted DNA-binding transcriptional regulator
LAMPDWAVDLSEDYHAAAVRLATVTEGRVQHLLFASIEMYPHEIPRHRKSSKRKRKTSTMQTEDGHRSPGRRSRLQRSHQPPHLRGRHHAVQRERHEQRLTAKLKEIKGDADATDEIKALKVYLALVEQEAVTANRLAEAQQALTVKVAAKYPKLTEDEIKTLVVEDKWLGTLRAPTRPRSVVSTVRESILEDPQ